MLGCKWPCIAGPIAFLRRLFKRVLVVGALRIVHRHLQLIHMFRVGVEPGVQPFALEVDDGAIVAHLSHFRHWVIGHGGGGRRDVAKILEWQERVRGNRLAKADQDPSFGGMG